jgi:hypothetical protein
MTELGASLKYFSGGDEVDHREYRRWKQWVINKLKLPKEARGSFVWTLLQGRALEIVEHLAATDYQKEDGDQVILKLLDERWPQKERSEEMGEHILEIFAVRQWCGRARECFDRCKRKTGVSFPEEARAARGWILLQCSGMNEEQRAVVLARTQGDLKFDAMSTSMRSCFPDYVVAKRRAVGAHVVEPRAAMDETAEIFQAEPEVEFDDVELFLAEHCGLDSAAEPEDTYEEHEIADILAVSWKEKQQELNKLKQSRQFQKEAGLKKTYRIEVEEFKKRTTCHRCKKVGHWARECRSKPAIPRRLQVAPMPPDVFKYRPRNISCVQRVGCQTV